MFSLRRMTLFMLFVAPITTLFLMMMGIALTQAAILQKTIVQTAPLPPQTEQVTANLRSASPAAAASVPGLVVPVPTAFGSTTDKILAIAGTVPLFLFLWINWMNRRRDYGNRVGEGSVGSSSASNL